MTPPINILLQTTIEPTENDWHIGRFSMLRDYLASLTTPDGAPMFQVTARDRDPVGVSDSVLSKHLKQLEEAGYVKLSKAASEGRQRTWLSLTANGRKAFSAHVAELTRLAGAAG